ncbi:hypothetical protein PIB30_040338 [Stylosanthes scabra]|uniref:Uncharacterized protein n=1 Tax=Stylosanthes scabra TaxID=79078 RepID=A0ABU6UES6_9FABA|nr:hypothetical protein [Stylosanthes scabra]
MEGRLKFEEAKTEMKVDSDPFEVNSNFVEPCCFEVHMVGFHSFEFDTSLGHFEQNIRQTNSNNPTAMQWMQVHGNQDRDFKEYNEYQNRRSFRGHGGRGRGRFNGCFGQNRGRGRFHSHGVLSRNPPDAVASLVVFNLKFS